MGHGASLAIPGWTGHLAAPARLVPRHRADITFRNDDAVEGHHILGLLRPAVGDTGFQGWGVGLEAFGGAPVDAFPVPWIWPSIQKACSPSGCPGVSCFSMNSALIHWPCGMRAGGRAKEFPRNLPSLAGFFSCQKPYKFQPPGGVQAPQCPHGSMAVEKRPCPSGFKPDPPKPAHLSTPRSLLLALRVTK